VPEHPVRGGWRETVGCKAHGILRSETYSLSVAATKEPCNAADGRFPTARARRLARNGQMQGAWRETVGCKAHGILRSETYCLYVAATKEPCNAADGRFPTAS